MEVKLDTWYLRLPPMLINPSTFEQVQEIKNGFIFRYYKVGEDIFVTHRHLSKRILASHGKRIIDMPYIDNDENLREINSELFNEIASYGLFSISELAKYRISNQWI